MTDWARLLVSSSNLSFIFFASYFCFSALFSARRPRLHCWGSSLVNLNSRKTDEIFQFFQSLCLWLRVETFPCNNQVALPLPVATSVNMAKPSTTAVPRALVIAPVPPVNFTS